MKYLFFLFLSFGYIHAGELVSLSSATAATATAVPTTSVLTTGQLMSNMINKTVLAYNISRDPLGTAMVQGVYRGIDASHPYMAAFVGHVLEGKASYLLKLKDQLLRKIKGSWLPMRWEKKQIVTIDHLLGQPMAFHFEKLRSGTVEEVRGAFYQMRQEEKRYQMVNSPDKLFTKEDWEHGMKLMRQNPNLSKVRQLDMLIWNNDDAIIAPAYDFILTTPTNSDLFDKYVTSSPERNFSDYATQIKSLIVALEEKGLYTAETMVYFIEKFAEGTAKHLLYVIEHPSEYIKDIAYAQIDLIKRIGLLFLNAYSSPEELYINPVQMKQYEESARQYAEAVTKTYNELKRTIPTMGCSEWADLTSRFFVDSILLHGASKGLSIAKDVSIPAFVKENPLLEKVHNSLGQFLTKHPEMVTAEGIVIKGVESLENSTFLRSITRAIEKGPIVTTKQATKMAEILGFKKTNYFSNGQRVFKKGNRFIAIDIDSHNGGVWKMADSVKNLADRKTRMGTYDQFLNRIGD